MSNPNPLEIPPDKADRHPNEGRMDLWIEGGWGDETIAFREYFMFDFDRFQYDDVYAHIISTYISMGLAHLAEEVEELAKGLKMRLERENVEACMD